MKPTDTAFTEQDIETMVNYYSIMDKHFPPQSDKTDKLFERWQQTDQSIDWYDYMYYAAKAIEDSSK